MNNKKLEFSKQLIKGKIAEMIFEQMLRDAGGFTVLSFGYESVLPELANRQNDLLAEETMEIIRRAPDFAVINNTTHDVHLIEVKYQRHLSQKYVLEAAEKMYSSWKPSYLFIVTPEGFFYGSVKALVESGGKIERLRHDTIPAELQDKYIELLNRFIGAEVLE